MLFSIIVPVYNVEKYLDECLTSILNQSYSDEYELILVDDGSTDNSGLICDNYEKNNTDKQKKICTYHKKNGGLSETRNYGVDIASGDYIIFVDSDDYIDFESLSTMERCINGNKGIEVIISEGMYDVYSDKDIKESFYWNAEQFGSLSGEKAYQKTAIKAANWSPCGKVFDRKKWIEQGYVFAVGRKAEDFQLIDRVVIEAKSVSMIKGFYYYRHREGSIITTCDSNLLRDIMLSIKEWEMYIEKNKLELKTRQLLRERFTYMYCHDIIGGFTLLPKSQRKKIKADMKSLLYLLNVSSDKEVVITKWIIRICGIYVSTILAGIIKRIRIRRKMYKRE